jgi:hypothetical protein
MMLRRLNATAVPHRAEPGSCAKLPAESGWTNDSLIEGNMVTGAATNAAARGSRSPARGTVSSPTGLEHDGRWHPAIRDSEGRQRRQRDLPTTCQRTGIGASAPSAAAPDATTAAVAAMGGPIRQLCRSRASRSCRVVGNVASSAGTRTNCIGTTVANTNALKNSA